MAHITEQERALLLDTAKSQNTKYSLLLGITVVLIYAILFFTHSGGTVGVELIPIAVFIIGIIAFNVIFRKNMKGLAQFGEIFSNGFKTVALVTIFIILWNVIAVYAFPGFKINEIEMTRQTYIPRATTEEAKAEIEEALKELQINRVFFLAKIKSILTFPFFLGVLMDVFSAMFLRARNN